MGLEEVLDAPHQRPHVAATATWRQIVLCRGAVPCIVGYVAASSAFTHEMPVAPFPPPHCDKQ